MDKEYEAQWRAEEALEKEKELMNCREKMSAMFPDMVVLMEQISKRSGRSLEKFLKSI